MSSYSIGCLSFHYDTDAGVCYRTLDFLECSGYRVGDDGSVWSRWARQGWGKTSIRENWKRSKLRLTGRGYKVGRGYLGIRLTPSSPGKKQRWSAHRLVLTAFAGPCPEGLECRHLNGIRTDNRLGNLAWGTPEVNNADKKIHGTQPQGEGNNLAKLTEKDVREIHRLGREGKLNNKTIGALFGVTGGTVSLIFRRKGWEHLGLPSIPSVLSRRRFDQK